MNRSTGRLIALCILSVVAVAPGLAVAGPEGRDGSFAYLANGGSITMSGDATDVAHARRFRDGGGPLLWFREGGQEYIVRDPDTLAQLDAVWKPERELDAQEATLDRQQEQLDHKHDQLENKRDALEARRDALVDQASELAERAADDAVSAAERAEAAKQRRKVQDQQQALVGEMHGLEAPMKDLRTQIEAVQHQLDALAQKQKQAESQQKVELRALFRRAIAAGTARPVK